MERAARRRRVDVALRRAGVATGLEEFEQDVGDVRRSMPVSFEQYLQGRVPFEDGFFDLVELAQRIQREYEVCAWLSVLPWRSRGTDVVGQCRRGGARPRGASIAHRSADRAFRLQNRKSEWKHPAAR